MNISTSNFSTSLKKFPGRLGKFANQHLLPKNPVKEAKRLGSPNTISYIGKKGLRHGIYTYIAGSLAGIFNPVVGVGLHAIGIIGLMTGGLFSLTGAASAVKKIKL